ncbi:unnamed protein product [Toxocara canis]|uniref:Uncharacterized protein n=1 Tax=Toxocara canis TaxID=6265 RepID=A0A183UTS9_TOXCA|nr:unnamed protein product [Toxocara canis]
MPDEKTKSSNVPKQKSSRQTHINDLLITTAYRQQIRNEFLENVRKDISNMCEIANVAESERNKRIEQLNDETRALIECANEYMAKANEQLASLARTDPSTNTNVNIEELIESTKEEFRQMFEMYMKEFRFDKIYIDDLIEGAVNEFALTEPTFRSHDNTIEMELMRKIAEKEKQIENVIN